MNKSPTTYKLSFFFWNKKFNACIKEIKYWKYFLIKHYDVTQTYECLQAAMTQESTHQCYARDVTAYVTIDLLTHQRRMEDAEILATWLMGRHGESPSVNLITANILAYQVPWFYLFYLILILSYMMLIIFINCLKLIGG